MIKIQKLLNNLGKGLFAILKILLLSKFKPSIQYESNKSECIIMGNGPSLKNLVTSKSKFIKGKDLFCVNFFPLSDLYEQLKPQFCIISAPELWLEDVDKVYHEKRDTLIEVFNNRTNWKLMILIPFAARKSPHWSKEGFSNKNVDIIYYNNIGIEGPEKMIFRFFRRGLAMPRPHNVLIPSLMCSINMGYKKIFLWGAENNQFKELTVDENNVAHIHQKHFYDKENSRPATMKKLGKGKRKIHEILYKFMLSFEAYHVIDRYAKTRGVEIINQTPDSLIDAFKREKINS